MLILARKIIKIRNANPMKIDFLKSGHPFLQLLFMIFIMLTSLLIFNFLGMLLAVPFFHVDIFNLASLTEDLHNPHNISLLKYLQFIQSISMFVIPPFLLLPFIGENGSRFFGMKIRAGAFAYLLVIVVMISLIPVNNFLADWNSRISFQGPLEGLGKMLRTMEQNADNLTKEFLKMDHLGNYLVNMLMIAIIPALGEEFTFRGIFQPLFIRWTKNIHVGIFLTGFIFSFFHFQFFGFFPRWLLGVLFGYLYYWSGTIWVPVLAHFINNGVAVTAYWIYGSEKVEEQVDRVGTSTNDFSLYIGIILVIISLYIFYLDQKRKKHSLTEKI